MNSFPRRMRGLSLIELMIALILGLLVVGGAIGVFMSNRKTYSATESVGRIQENGRVAFEIMAREVREAAGNPCGKSLPMANVLADASGWWANWASGLRGFEGGTTVVPMTGAAAGTDAIELMSATAGAYTISGSENASGPDAELTLNTTTHDLQKGDILVVCDYTQVSMFQMTGPNSTNAQVIHSANAGGLEPGNCTKGLGLPVHAGCNTGTKDTNGTSKAYGPNSQVAKLHAVQWYVGSNGRGSNSLFRRRMSKGALLAPEEIAEGVQDMELQYLVADGTSYAAASGSTQWPRVTAVRIALTLQAVRGAQRARELEGTTKGQALQRTLVHTVALRNRMP